MKKRYQSIINGEQHNSNSISELLSLDGKTSCDSIIEWIKYQWDDDKIEDCYNELFTWSEDDKEWILERHFGFRYDNKRKVFYNEN